MLEYNTTASFVIIVAIKGCCNTGRNFLFGGYSHKQMLTNSIRA